MIINTVKNFKAHLSFRKISIFQKDIFYLLINHLLLLITLKRSPLIFYAKFFKMSIVLTFFYCKSLIFNKAFSPTHPVHFLAQ